MQQHINNICLKKKLKFYESLSNNFHKILCASYKIIVLNKISLKKNVSYGAFGEGEILLTELTLFKVLKLT